MAFRKALCVMLLLCATRFGENRTLQNNSNSEKGTTDIQTTTKRKFKQLFRCITESSCRPTDLQINKRFLYIYVQQKIKVDNYMNYYIANSQVNEFKFYDAIGSIYIAQLTTMSNVRKKRL